MSEEGEFEEVADKWDAKGAYHNGNNSEEKTSAKLVEWARNPVDEDKVNGKSDKNRGGGKLWSSKLIDVSEGGKNSHTNRDS